MICNNWVSGLTINRRALTMLACSAPLLLISCASTTSIAREIAQDFVEVGEVVVNASQIPRLSSENAFSWADHNKDGHISFAEYEGAVSRDYRYRELASREDLTVARYIAKDFAGMDVNGDRVISYDEFLTIRASKAHVVF